MIKKVYATLRSSLLQIFAPPFCLYCAKSLQERVILCPPCMLKIQVVAPYDLQITAQKTVPVYALGAYQNPLRKLVLSKYTKNISVFDALATHAAQQNILQHIDFDCIVPVPLHWTRYAYRGFNQAALLAQKISMCTGKPVIDLVARSVMTDYQISLTPQKREENVSGAFSISQNQYQQIAGKQILLVDDLFTTGATMRSLVKTLLQAKPKSIHIFVICRALSS